MAAKLEIAKIDVVIANRALARVGAVDAYGHVSVRNPEAPDRFLISRSLSPDLVDRDDIMQIDLNGQVLDGDRRPPYLERFIHAAIYAERPDVNSVVHGHPRLLLPFTVTDVKLRPLFFTCDEFGPDVPCWDIRDRFGDQTDLLIVNLEQGLDLARALGAEGRTVLLRGHGFVAAARSAGHAIRICKALLDNAAVQLDAVRLGGTLKEMSAGELAARQRTLSDDDAPARTRDFEYEATKTGLIALLQERTRLKANA